MGFFTDLIGTILGVARFLGISDGVDPHAEGRKYAGVHFSGSSGRLLHAEQRCARQQYPPDVIIWVSADATLRTTAGGIWFEREFPALEDPPTIRSPKRYKGEVVLIGECELLVVIIGPPYGGVETAIRRFLSFETTTIMFYHRSSTGRRK